MTNKEVAGRFELLAELLEMSGENSFKTKSYSIAAFRIGKLDKDIFSMTDSEIKKIENIGPAVIAKIEELKTTGTIAVLDQLIQSTPPGIIEMLQIKGLGAKKVRQLWLELEIESIGELLYACQENRISMLKGFGIKIQENIKKNIEFLLSNKDHFLYKNVDLLLNDLRENLKNRFVDYNFALVGDFGMQNNIITKIEWITDIPLNTFKDALEELDFELKEETDGMLIVRNSTIKEMFFYFENKDDFEFELFNKNSSVEFATSLYTQLNVTKISENDYKENKYALPYIAPAKREKENWDKYINHQIGNIDEKDIKGLIHCHSKYSDGANTMEEMAKASIEKGYEYMIITDHSQAAFYANGLTRERILQQHQEIDQLNIQLAPFKIFKGIEADILYNGDIDYDENVWKSMDVIIASVHSNLQMDIEKATERIMTALDNPYVKILGHPSGRLLLSRAGYPIEHKLIIDKCIEKGIAIELNANPRRLDIDWRWVNYIIDNGGMISINPDAHSIEGIDVIKYGILSAQKSMVEPQHNLSSKSLNEISDWIKN